MAIFLIFSFGIIYQNISNDPFADDSVDKFGITQIYPTKDAGRTWFTDWDNGKSFSISNSFKSSPYDNEFFFIGDGSVSVDGNGIATMSGSSPRMYVYDPDEKKTWDNVEVTIYGKRISESKYLSYSGFTIGAKSNHHQASEAGNDCDGTALYGKLLYDGRANFSKELVHHAGNSNSDGITGNKPSESYHFDWNTGLQNGYDGADQMPRNEWIGVKYIVRTHESSGHVSMELLVDRTNGVNGGQWESAAVYTDSGSWIIKNPSIIDSIPCSNLSPTEILSGAGGSIFIRNDGINESLYKNWSIREISSLP